MRKILFFLVFSVLVLTIFGEGFYITSKENITGLQEFKEKGYMFNAEKETVNGKPFTLYNNKQFSVKDGNVMIISSKNDNYEKSEMNFVRGMINDLPSPMSWERSKAWRRSSKKEANDWVKMPSGTLIAEYRNNDFTYNNTNVYIFNKFEDGKIFVFYQENQIFQKKEGGNGEIGICYKSLEKEEYKEYYAVNNPEVELAEQIEEYSPSQKKVILQTEESLLNSNETIKNDSVFNHNTEDKPVKNNMENNENTKEIFILTTENYVELHEETAEEKLSEAIKNSPYVIVRKQLDVYDGPGTEYQKIFKLEFGSKALIIGMQNNFRWIKIYLPELKLTGWVEVYGQYIDYHLRGYTIPTATYRPFSKTLKIISSERYSHSEFCIKNNSGRDGVVLLTDLSGCTLYSAYVRSGSSSFTIRPINSGNYNVYFITGTGWNGKNFNVTYQRKKFSDIFHFDSTTIWTITLHLVLNGNASTETVPESQFPSF